MNSLYICVIVKKAFESLSFCEDHEKGKAWQKPIRSIIGAMPPVPSVLDIISRRFAIPRGRSTLIGVERVLASVRTVLAFSSLLLLWLNPGVAYPRDVAAILVYLYLAHAIGLLAIVYLRAEISPRFSFLVHSGDILWAAVISLFGGAAENWFFLYFIFALLAAAFRWGMRETAMTTVAVVATMALDSIARARAPTRCPSRASLRGWLHHAFHQPGDLLLSYRLHRRIGKASGRRSVEHLQNFSHGAD